MYTGCNILGISFLMTLIPMLMFPLDYPSQSQSTWPMSDFHRRSSLVSSIAYVYHSSFVLALCLEKRSSQAHGYRLALRVVCQGRLAEFSANS